MNGYKFIAVLVLALFCISISTEVVLADRGHRRGHVKKHHVKKRVHRRAVHRRSHRRHVFHAPGHRVARLPRRIHRITHHRRNYFYHLGMFYRPHRSGYVVIRAPIGINVYALPPGYRRFHIGSRYYFYANSAYYAWLPSTRQYVVIDRPDGADAALAAAYDDGATVPRGYSEQYCHEQAIKQSGYYPGLPDDHGALHKMYQQVMATCLEGG